MRKPVSILVGYLCLTVSICTIFLVACGETKYEQACQYMEQHQDAVATDQDITDVLKMYGFNDLDWSDKPTSWDYLKSNF